MRIIKQGNYRASVKSKFFYCERCGCEFEADYSEYKGVPQIAYIHDGITAECQCPSCGNVAYAYEGKI